MPIVIQNETVTDSYSVQIGGGGGQYGYGTLIVTANNVDLIFEHGLRGQTDELEVLSLPPGTYPLVSGPQDLISGLTFRNSVAGQVAVVSCLLFEPGRAGLAPAAVINPLSSGGIKEITSVDGSVVVVAPFGPITDLSVPGVSGFLHWGVNTDGAHLGLTMNAFGDVQWNLNSHAFNVITSAPGTIDINATNSDFNIHTDHASVSTSGAGTSLNLSGVSVNVNAGAGVLINAVNDIELRSAFFASGDIYLTTSASRSIIIRSNGGTVLAQFTN